MESKCIYITRYGGPEVLEQGTVEVGAPGKGEVLVRYSSIGVNYADAYLRSGEMNHHGAAPPIIPGLQGVGTVLACGPGVDGYEPGDRVTHAGTGIGAYTEYRLLPAGRLLKLPAGLDDDLVAAAHIRGLTAHYLLRRLYVVKPGDTVLVHAAAGGVGQILVQWAKVLGATVIGTVGTDAKADFIKTLGCDHAIVYSREDFVARVSEITAGEGVPGVYDSVGADTFFGSLDCLAPMGLCINYGTASGPVPPFPLQILHKKSLSVSRPTLQTWMKKRSDLDWSTAEFFDLLASGQVRLKIEERVPLAEAERAHRLLESRTLAGAVVLRP